MRGGNARQKIRFGSRQITFEVRRGECAARLEPATPSQPDAADAILDAALARPVGSPPLSEIAAGRKTAAIVVPGADRMVAALVSLPRRS